MQTTNCHPDMKYGQRKSIMSLHIETCCCHNRRVLSHMRPEPHILSAAVTSFKLYSPWGGMKIQPLKCTVCRDKQVSIRPLNSQQGYNVTGFGAIKLLILIIITQCIRLHFGKVHFCFLLHLQLSENKSPLSDTEQTRLVLMVGGGGLKPCNLIFKRKAISADMRNLIFIMDIHKDKIDITYWTLNMYQSLGFAYIILFNPHKARIYFSLLT